MKYFKFKKYGHLVFAATKGVLSGHKKCLVLLFDVFLLFLFYSFNFKCYTRTILLFEIGILGEILKCKNFIFCFFFHFYV